MKLPLVVLVGVLACAGWAAYRHGNNVVFPSIPKDVTYPATATHPAWQGNLTPEAYAVLQGKVKGPERTLVDHWEFSEESRKRLDKISRSYTLSPEDQRRSDELSNRTERNVELATKYGYLPK